MGIIPYDTVAGAVVVFFAVIGAISAILSLVEKIHNMRKPTELTRKQILRDIEELRAINFHQTRAIKCILHHMVYGDHKSELEAELKILERLVKDDPKDMKS